MKSAAFASSLLIALLIGDLEAMEFEEVGLLGLVFMATAVASLGLLLAGGRHALRGLALALVLLTSTILGGAIRNTQVEASKLRGDGICAALATYRHRVGTYPTHLSALVPLDLPHLPATALGMLRMFDFSYVPDSTDDFVLIIRERVFTTWRRSATAQWKRFD